MKINSMKTHLAFIIVSACLSFASSEVAAKETILLWPDDPKLNAPEGMGRVEVTNKTRVSNVKTPHLRLYATVKSKHSTPAVILVPGGGYSRLVTSTHDASIKWFQEQGVRPFMLMYRCPKRKDVLADIQRAIRMVRSRAKEWNIDPKRVGVLGSSAGGHLSVLASCSFDTKAYPHKDAIDKMSARPDFAILLYPAYLADKKTGKLKEDIKVPKHAPPTMIFAAKNDGFFKNSPAYEKALKEAGATVRSLYLDKGGHGFTMSPAWSGSCLKWLQEFKIVSIHL